MPVKERLTPEFVNALQPPEAGERWIADTVVSGFGIRIWATRSGLGCAYAIRVADKSGRMVRKSFDIHAAVYRSWEWRLNPVLTPPRGDFLKEARKWAREEIALLKGRKPPSERRAEHRARKAAKVMAMPFQQAVTDHLDKMRSQGLTDAYVDRLEKLFFNHIPDRCYSQSLDSVSVPVLGAALAGLAEMSFGNAGILRSFISQVFIENGRYVGPLHGVPNKLADAFWTELRARREQGDPQDGLPSEEQYQALFDYLENEQKHWQQASCLRLYFAFRAPLSRLMAAEWNQVVDGIWYPYTPD